MQAARRNTLLIAGAVAFVALCVFVGWLWGHKRTQDLESSARGSIAAATVRLEEALELPPEAPDALAKLEEHAKVVGQYLAVLRREDASRNKPLAETSELYLVDAQAMLRNQANAVRAHAAAFASRRALAAHMSHSAGRGQGWIQQALELKTRAERDNFDYRSSMAAWAELLRTHHDTQDKVRAALPPARLLEPATLDAAYQRAKEAEKEAAAELERIRQMAIAR
jgi:hypothetical protein